MDTTTAANNSKTTTTPIELPYVPHTAPANWRSDPPMLTWKDVGSMETDEREEALKAMGYNDAGDDTPEAIAESVNRWLARMLFSSPKRAADLIAYAKLAFVFAMQHEEAAANASK